MDRCNEIKLDRHGAKVFSLSQSKQGALKTLIASYIKLRAALGVAYFQLQYGALKLGASTD
jgi:hypothetical protein